MQNVCLNMKPLPSHAQLLSVYGLTGFAFSGTSSVGINIETDGNWENIPSCQDFYMVRKAKYHLKP